MRWRSAMRAGAVDFVVKPVTTERLQVSIENALKLGALEGELQRLKRRAAGTLTFDDIVIRSPAMERVVGLARRAAASQIPILVEGESGVGKEQVARAIQGSSERKARPFVTVNCAALAPRSGRIRPLRPREGRLRRRREKPGRQGPRGRQGDAVPRRGRRAAARCAGKARARRSRRARSSRSGPAVRFASTSG